MAIPDVTRMTTEELDQLRDAIAIERIKRKPEITMQQPLTMEAAFDPKWTLTPADAGTYVQLRHPGYGWVGYLIPPASRAQLATVLLQHALLPPMPKSENLQIVPSTGGGAVH